MLLMLLMLLLLVMLVLLVIAGDAGDAGDVDERRDGPKGGMDVMGSEFQCLGSVWRRRPGWICRSLLSVEYAYVDVEKAG